MAKFKAVRDKPKKSNTRGLIPCLLLVIGAVILMSFFFYAMLKSGTS